MGSTELVVNTDRVGIERLHVGVISSLSVATLGVATASGSASGSGNLADLVPRVLVAEVVQTSQLTRKYQVCTNDRLTYFVRGFCKTFAEFSFQFLRYVP